MIDLGVAYDKLAQFETSQEIAEYLQSEGVKGLRASSDRCAIAVWVQDLTGQQVLVNPGGMYTLVLNDETGIMGYKEQFENTEAMYEFICMFDSGQYPDLIIRQDADYSNYCDEYFNEEGDLHDSF